MKTYANKAKPKKRSYKPTKEQILEYYRRMSYPHEFLNEPGRDNVFVPADLQMKAFEKLLQWREVEPPKAVTDTTPQRWIVEIKEAD